MSFFVTQGGIRANAPCYVPRKADKELLTSLSRGEFCYVLTSRQMGKTSLIAQTAARLREARCSVVTIDLAGLGFNNVTVEQWYDGLVVKIGHELKLEDELEDFWLDNERLGPVQRLFTALREVALPLLPAPPKRRAARPKLVIFIDEIDTVRSLPFRTDEFFAAVRGCLSADGQKGNPPELTFAFFGVATPSELIADPGLTPFSLGHRIELADFTPEEAEPLAQGLGRPKAEAHALLSQVLRWTHGHPYLTQFLCQALVADPLLDNPADVDRICEELFLSRRSIERNDNLLFVRERLLRSTPNRAGVLQLYEQVHSHKAIPDDESNPLNDALRLSGIVRVENGLLTVRNRIYFHAFNKDWIQETLKSLTLLDTVTLAVLPFVDQSVERSDYLCDGLAYELINALGTIPWLRVASPGSVFVFKGKAGDPRQIGTQLGVSRLLEGDVRHLGRRVRVAVRIIAVADGRQTWSKGFKFSVEDIHLITEEIVREVLPALDPSQGHTPRPSPPAAPKPPDREAYHQYLKGRYYWNRRNESSVDRSVSYFESAIAKDPDYAAAYAGLADAYIILGVYNFRPATDVLPRAKEAALRALEIDENLADAHCAMGCVHSVYDHDWVKAERSFSRAIALNPSYANARLWYGINCLSPLGRHEEALTQLRLAQEVDPLSIRTAASIGLALHLAGRDNDAIAQCRYTIELDDTFWLTYLFLGCAHMQKREMQEATQAFQTSVDLSQGDAVALAALGHCYALQGRTQDAQRILEGLINLSRVRHVPATEIATMYAGLRQMDTARQWMERAHKERSFRLIYLRVDPRLAEFRDL